MARILLVDDDLELGISMRVALEWQGYVVDAFDKPEIAFQRFSAKKYDIVIIDAKKKGIELASMIYDKDKGTKIILMSKSDLGREEFEKAGIATKIDAFMKKPRGIIKLINHVEALLKQKKREFVSSVTATIVSMIAISSDAFSF